MIIIITRNRASSDHWEYIIEIQWTIPIQSRGFTLDISSTWYFVVWLDIHVAHTWYGYVVYCIDIKIVQNFKQATQFFMQNISIFVKYECILKILILFIWEIMMKRRQARDFNDIFPTMYYWNADHILDIRRKSHWLLCKVLTFSVEVKCINYPKILRGKWVNSRVHLIIVCTSYQLDAKTVYKLQHLSVILKYDDTFPENSILMVINSRSRSKTYVREC